MIYFTRTVVDALDGQRVELAIDITGNAGQIERLEAQGFMRCSLEAFREAWRKNDVQAFARMRAAVLLAHAPQA
jgi:hypothetical protein